MPMSSSIGFTSLVWRASRWTKCGATKSTRHLAHASATRNGTAIRCCAIPTPWMVEGERRYSESEGQRENQSRLRTEGVARRDAGNGRHPSGPVLPARVNWAARISFAKRLRRKAQRREDFRRQLVGDVRQGPPSHRF